MHFVLRAAHAAGCTTIVLGAWGCGVFGNQPPVVAELWSEVLDSLEWRGRSLYSCDIRGASGRARPLDCSVPSRPSPARPLGLHVYDGRTLPTPRGARGVTPPPIQSYLLGCTYAALRSHVFMEWALDHV